MTLLLGATIKATIAIALSLAAISLLRRASAATRHSILVAGQIAALLVPLLAFAVPPLAVPVPRALPEDDATFTGVVVAAVAQTRPMQREARPVDPWVLVWACGCAAIAFSRATSLLRAASIIRHAASFRDVRISGSITQPATLGRTIVLPSAARAWDEPRLRAVLLHERAHVTRHDSLTGLLADAVCAIYWFHPLAWIAARRASLERERACDDAVLAHGIDARDYALALLDVARANVQSAAVGMPMAARPHLEQRIRAILNPRVQRTTTRLARILVAIAAIAAAPLLAALTTASITKPLGIEPDLRGDAFVSPFSEYIGAPQVDVDATGPDAALIATLQQVASHSPRSPIDFVPDRARWALAQTRDGELVAPLIQALRDSDWRVRAYAAFNLGVAGDRRATNELVRQLDDAIWRVRAMAASALAAIADPAASPAMQRALSDDAWQVRSEAVKYFAAVGAKRSLFETMRRDRHMAVRAAAEEALR